MCTYVGTGFSFYFVFFAAKPHWVQLLEDVEIAVGDNLFWECRANGKPKASYRWLKDGEALVLEVSAPRSPALGPPIAEVNQRPEPGNGQIKGGASMSAVSYSPGKRGLPGFTL